MTGRLRGGEPSRFSFAGAGRQPSPQPERPPITGRELVSQFAGLLE